MNYDRRNFLAGSIGTAVVSALSSYARGSALLDEALPSRLAADPRRPQYHLLPASNWMNDPNGPIYFNGRYHMFFQYNPQAATWGDMSWNHAVSKDMLHWTLLPLALTPTPDSPDAYGVFSGSAIQIGARVYVVYTGTRESTPELATIRDGENKIQESQCLAWSDDPLLIRWTKDPQPIIPMPPEGMKITGFRDPSVWRQGEWYYMTVGAGVAKLGGCVLLYRSKASGDLKSWEYLHKLTEGAWNGNPTANPCDDGEMWECPEFFALDGGHVLIYSTLGKVFWQSGTLDMATMKFAPKKTGLLDLDAFYAPKTQLDAQGRRILWGWIPERRSEAAMREARWSGMMSLPRVLRLDRDGTLRVQALPETSNLRVGSFRIDESAAGLRSTLREASGEVLCTGSRRQPMELTMSDSETELLHVNYSPGSHSFIANGQEVALSQTDVPALHAFIDGSVIEVILSERIGYTKRFYYPGNTAPDISVSAAGRGVKLSAWKMEPISNNRMTTQAGNMDVRIR